MSGQNGFVTLKCGNGWTDFKIFGVGATTWTSPVSERSLMSPLTQGGPANEIFSCKKVVASGGGVVNLRRYNYASLTFCARSYERAFIWLSRLIWLLGNLNLNWSPRECTMHMVVELNKMTPWGLVPGHLDQNWWIANASKSAIFNWSFMAWH